MKTAPRSAATASILVTIFLDALGFGLAMPILPRIVSDMLGSQSGASYGYGLLVAIYSLAIFLFSPILGRLSDQWGRRPIVLVTLAGAAIDYVVTAWAGGFGLLVAARLIAGVCGANISTAAAYVADVTAPDARAKSFGLIGAAYGLGFIVGPPLGGLLATFGLRIPFLVAAVLTGFNFLYGLLALPESLALQNRRPFRFSIRQLIAPFVFLQRAQSMVRALASALFFYQMTGIMIQTTWVVFVHYRFGWNTTTTGWSIATMGLMNVLVQGFLTPPIIRRLGAWRTIILGMVVNFASLFGLGLISDGGLIYAFMILGSLGYAAGPALQGQISSQIPASQQGELQGSLVALASLSAIIGSPVASLTLGYFISPKAPIVIPGAAFFLAGLSIAVSLALAVRAFQRRTVSQSQSLGG